MTNISTDSTKVDSITSSFKQSVNGLSFNCNSKIGYSKSPAVRGLKSCLSSLNSSVKTFKSNVTTDVTNINKIHQAIVDADSKVASGN